MTLTNDEIFIVSGMTEKELIKLCMDTYHVSYKDAKKWAHDEDAINL
jgi:hypothetical protein